MDKKYHTTGGGARVVKPLKKSVFFIILLVSLALVATVITLSLTLGNKNKTLPPVGEIPTDPPASSQPVTMLNPLATFTVAKEFAHDKLLWCSSLGLYETHSGIDFGAEDGAQVFAVLDGTVESVTDSALDGTVIVVAHGNGLKTVYMSLDPDTLVQEGQAVSRGEVIGHVGNTMLREVNDGAHPHFEVMVNGAPADPTFYLVDLIEK